MADKQTTGIFSEIGTEMCELLNDITSRGNDAEVRKRSDGSFDIFELEKKRRRPRKETE